MNHVDEMKTAMREYRKALKDAKTQVNTIRENYGNEAAQHEQARQDAVIAKARSSAQQKIREAHANAVRSVEHWGTLDGNQLTKDAELLRNGLVNPEQFEGLKHKYHDNYTMLSALQKYADSQNAEHMKKAHQTGTFALGGPYRTNDIPTTESKIESWNKLKNGALNMLDHMDGSAGDDPYSQAWFNVAGAEAIESFGGDEENL